MANEFGRAEPDAVCPVPLDEMGALYRADPVDLPDLVHDMPAERRVRLAVFCYGRAHLRDLGLRIAATCTEAQLVDGLGLVGQALAMQSRAATKRFGAETAARPTGRPKVSLAGGRR